MPFGSLHDSYVVGALVWSFSFSQPWGGSITIVIQRDIPRAAPYVTKHRRGGWDERQCARTGSLLRSPLFIFIILVSTFCAARTMAIIEGSLDFQILQYFQSSPIVCGHRTFHISNCRTSMFGCRTEAIKILKGNAVFFYYLYLMSRFANNDRCTDVLDRGAQLVSFFAMR